MPPKFVKFAHALDGETRGARLSEAELVAALAEDTPAWVHLDGNDPGAADWIGEHLNYLDPQAIEALLDADTRARVSVLGSGMMVILRCVNPKAKTPEDMSALRMWIDGHRIVTIARHSLPVVARMDRGMSSEDGPRDAGTFLVRLVEDIQRDIARFQKDMQAKAEDLEAQVISETGDHLARDVASLRLQLITARRYLAPQIEAIQRIGRNHLPWVDQTTRREIEEEHLKLTRIVEDLEASRDQAAVLREELSGQLSDRLNRNMFFLSVISAIFLPLGFLTGLFGVNVGGVPGTGDSDAFLWLCLGMGGLAVFLVVLLWWMRWIGGRNG